MKIWAMVVKGQLPGKVQVNFKGHLCSINAVYAPTIEEAIGALHRAYPLFNIEVLVAFGGLNIPFSMKKIGVVGAEEMIYPKEAV